MAPSPAEQAEIIAKQAGILLLNLFNPAGVPATQKHDRSLMTEADLAADQFISQALQEKFPKTIILSEERLTHLSENADEAWVVDPLDGTTNYSLGLHYWGVSIAYLRSGIPEAAAMYFPMLDEMYTAVRSQGAFMNGHKIEVRRPNPAQPAAFFSCCSRTHRKYKVNIPYKTRILGSGAYTICSVARGRALVGFEATPKIWDIAGAWLLVEQAGGAIELYQGKQPFPLQVGIDYATLDLPVLAAASPELLLKARGQIIPI